MAPTLQAKVKSGRTTLIPPEENAHMWTVLSGDTIVLVGKPRPDGKPPNERILSLAYVSAPRMKRDGDEVPALLLLESIYPKTYTNDSHLHLQLESTFENSSWAKRSNSLSPTLYQQ